MESELTQLMKQNGIQVNNNNSNSTERLNAQQHIPHRGMWGGGGRGGWVGTGISGDPPEFQGKKGTQ